MKLHHSIALVSALGWTLGSGAQATAQSERSSIGLVVQAGRPLRVALDKRVRVKRVGQPVTGILAEPVYAYDRIVLPAGTKVLGHVENFQRVSRKARVLAILNGDFTPLRKVILQFDSLVLDDGSEIPLRTEVRFGSQRVALEVRNAPRKKGVAARARKEVADRAKHAASTIKQPGKMQRLKYGLIDRLPYHPQYLSPGAVYTATLLSPLDFGVAEATEPAPEGTRPPPDSILRARLLSGLDSAKTERGSPVQAVVDQPLFSLDHRLVLPEGTVLTGEVTFAKGARRFHRNGQLRFLFETIQAPDERPEALKASLYSVEVGRGQRVALDDEGGATVTNSKTRFIAPALASLSLAASMQHKLDYDTDGGPPEMQYGTVQSHAAGGFIGLGMIGMVFSVVSRPAALGFGYFGLGRTMYVSVVGKGREVSFPADTLIEVQLGAEPKPEK